MSTSPASLIRKPAQLKVRFKELCAQRGDIDANWRIRVHRSLSWFKRAEEMPAEQAEARFLYLWITLSSLYSRWDPQKNTPAHDSASRRDFLRRVLAMDTDGLIIASLHQHRPLIKKLLGNSFLSPTFWRNPHDPKSTGRATEDVHYLEKNYRDKNYHRLLDQAFDQLNVLRRQIVHGASTGGSRLNRTTLRHCQTLIEHLLPAILSRRHCARAGSSVAGVVLSAHALTPCCHWEGDIALR